MFRFAFNGFIHAQLLLAIGTVIASSAIYADEVIPADPELRWWKGNIHTHTLWSDGNDFPEMVAEWYRTHHYNFLALSDHNVLSQGVRWMKHDKIVQRGGKTVMEKYLERFGPQWVETRGTQSDERSYEVRLKPLSEFRALVEERGRFIMIPGEEISDRAEGRPVHMNATNLQDVIQPLGGSTVREAIENNLRAVEDQARRTGREMLVHLNHPNFGLAITAEDLAAVISERFFEVYNGHPGVKHRGDQQHPSVERLWDIANTIRIAQLKAPPLLGVATDDSHRYHGSPGSRPGRGWIMVRCRHLTPETIIRAVKRGDFYASSGVTLKDVRFDAATETIELEIEPEDGVTFTTDFVGTPTDYHAGSKAQTDTKGKPLRATRKYSSQVGNVFATVEGTNPSYTLGANELYVRAVVTSSKAHPDPSFQAQYEQAWTQPVGWERWLNDAKSTTDDATSP